MRVEQAIYGEVSGRGHGLRTSSTAAPIAANIAPRLDLPDAVPQGVRNWSPFVRGFPFGEYYVLARTFLDSNASRGGMVLTHALILRLEDICEAESLASLFGCLRSSSEDCPDSLESLEIEATESDYTIAADLVGVANALATPGLAPVVHLGIERFEALVCSLWKNLWPALRRTFAFRLSFDPKDVVEQLTPMLVCTPEQLQARWAKHLIAKPDDQKPSSVSAEILCGQRDIQPVLALAERLGQEVHTLRELSKLERLHTLLSGSESFEDILAAIRLVDGLSTEPTHGESIKKKLLSQLESLIARAGCRQILLMRNLALLSFTNTQSLWSAVELLIGALEFLPSDDSDLIEIVNASVDDTHAVLPWRIAVKAGLLAAAQMESPAIYKAIWRWAERSHTAFAAAVSSLPAKAAFEQRLTREAPRTLKVTSSAALRSTLLRKQWLTTYGATLSATLSPLDATAQQLKVDRDQGDSSGLRSALRYAEPIQTLECALAHKDSRLIELCAVQATEHPEILMNIRCDDVTEQQLWCAAIEKELSLWSAPDNAIGVRDNVLARLHNGLPVDNNLLRALAQTPLADLSSAKDREHLWSILPSAERDHYLQATAIGWLDVAAKGQRVDPPEAPLAEAIVASPSLYALIDRSSAQFDVCLSIVGALPSLPEEVFINWLNNVLKGYRTLSYIDSEQLGALVLSRRWERTARRLADWETDRSVGLMPALRQCASLLGLYSRWTLGVHKPSREEKWKALEDMACDLYPSGPDSEELWSRAGGRNYKLPVGLYNGAARWRSVLSSVRYGSQPSARELIAVMLEDFPANERLRLFAKDPDIVGYR